MKNHCGESVGFSFRAVLWFWRSVILFTRDLARSECYNSTFLLFLPSSVMILLAFLSCFLVFFFVKDRIASFQLKHTKLFIIPHLRIFLVFLMSANLNITYVVKGPLIYHLLIPQNMVFIP